MNPLRVWGSRGTKPYNAREFDEQLRSLHGLTDSLARSNDSQEMVGLAVRAATSGTHAGKAIAVLYRREKNAYVGYGSAVGIGDDAAAVTIDVGESEVLDAAFFRGATFLGGAKEAGFLAHAVGARQALFVRLRSGEDNLGVLAVFDKHRKYGGFNGEDVVFAETIAQALDLALSALKSRQLQASAATIQADASVTRRRFDDYAQLEIERAEKLGHSLGCIAIEINGFEDIAARYGRQTADFAASQLADCVRRTARHIDVISRDDAKTLIALLPGTDIEAVNAFWTRLEEQVAARKFPSVGTLRVRHGISCYPGNADSATDVVVAALKNLRSDRTRAAGAA